jgi:hypothetical protein
VQTVNIEIVLPSDQSFDAPGTAILCPVHGKQLVPLSITISCCPDCNRDIRRARPVRSWNWLDWELTRMLR